MKKYVLLTLFAGTAGMIWVMAKTGIPLKTSQTPLGILNLEFAYNSEKVKAIIDSWSGNHVEKILDAAKLNTWLDFIFLFFYAFFLYSCCRFLAKLSNGVVSSIGHWLSIGALAAGILDILENTGMLISLSGHISDTTSLFTCICSIFKWLLALLAVGYILTAGIIVLVKKSNPAD